MNRNKLNISILGVSGLPYDHSAKCNLIISQANGLAQIGCEVNLINKFPRSKIRRKRNENDNPLIINPINYDKREDYKWSRRFYRILTQFVETYWILKLNLFKKNTFFYIYTESFFSFLKYFLLAKLTNSITILYLVEKRSIFEDRSFFITKINDYLFENLAIRMVDGVACITTYLKNYVLSKGVINNKTIIIPPTCDFTYFDSLSPYSTHFKYFLYCGSIAYKSVIEFVIESFNLANLPDGYKLLLIIQGDDRYIKKIEQQNLNIKVKSKLSYSELCSIYKGAEALIIPMRNIESDIARFPYKICEYVASKNLIISTKVGDIVKYFVDEENSLIADSYNANKLAKKIVQSYQTDLNREKIIKNCYLGLKENFNQKEVSEKLFNFLKSFLSNSQSNN